jgi:hypothetical protein
MRLEHPARTGKGVFIIAALFNKGDCIVFFVRCGTSISQSSKNSIHSLDLARQ